MYGYLSFVCYYSNYYVTQQALFKLYIGSSSLVRQRSQHKVIEIERLGMPPHYAKTVQKRHLNQ
jgi:hypothetical protein